LQANAGRGAGTPGIAFLVGLFLVFAPRLTPPCFASNTLQDAITDYNKGQYYPALKKLTALQAAQPKNAMVHYYGALCKQAVGQIAEARTEYQWVYAHGDGRLKALAQTGYARLGSYSARAGTVSSTAVAASTGPSSVLAMSGALAGTGASTNTANTVTANKGARLKKVIEFYSNTCPTCIEFAPTFDQTKSQFSDVEFQQIDVSDPSNGELVSRYNVRNYPTLVYLDGTGNILMNRSGAPIGVAAFASSLRRFHP
jgi:thiol-disulfide isomerase/thioredoxin